MKQFKGEVTVSMPRTQSDFPLATQPILGWRDLINPKRLLEKTDWHANPIVIYSERRSHRARRFIALRLCEVAIFFLAIWNFLPFSKWADEDLVHISLPCFIFLLIRYHLFANDQAMFIKTLSRSRVEELLLTHLGKNELFLHQYLIFCRTYRVVFVLAGVTAVFAVINLQAAKYRQMIMQYYLYFYFIITFFQAWLMGVYQFVLEWKLFAGGRLDRARPIISLMCSAIIAVTVAFFDIAVASICVNEFEIRMFNFLVGIMVMALPTVAAFAYILYLAKDMHSRAIAHLRRRVNR